MNEFVTQLRAAIVNGLGGKTKLVKYPLTTTAGAYTAGDNVGGKMSFEVLNDKKKTAILQSVLVKDGANQKASGEILIFDSNPTVTATDNSAFAYGTGAYDKLIARVAVASTDYVTTDSKAEAQKMGLGIIIEGDSTTTLYAVFNTQGTPTYGASSSVVSIVFGFLLD